MKYSLCIDSVFHGKDFLQSMNLVSEAGFDAIEFWAWWDRDIESINMLRKELDIIISTFCTPFISLVDSTRRNEYIEGLLRSIEIAKKLDCRTLITQVGNSLSGIDTEIQTASLIDGLKACTPFLEEAGITLLFEPLNTLIDHKGYFLSSSDSAFKIHDCVNNPNVKVLFDIYHQLVMGEDPYKQINDNIDKIGHFHVAGYPGRHELDSGSFSYTPLIQSINETGYSGYIGFEYMPVGNPEGSLTRLSLK